MLKKLALFCALIGMVAIAGSAYAEVQNIRVSGDITASGVYRTDYDLEDSLATDAFLMSVTRLRVDADLTDNVAACVSLANLRDWDTDEHLGDGTAGAEADPSASTDTSSIILDLANITLKEMLYSPLTLIIGRQELMYGNGLIVGNGRFQDPNNSIAYNDLSPLHGYDAVRAVLDYDPLTIDLILAKIEEGNDTAYASGTDRDSDTDLYGVNLGYRLDSYDAEIEGYFFAKRDENYDLILDSIEHPQEALTYTENKVYTLGLRGSLVPMENLSLAGEIAGQFGEITANQDIDAISYGVAEIDREAMAANVAGSYTLADVKFAPVLGVEYLYLSGSDGSDSGDFEAWDPMYRGKVMGTIRDFLENLYTTNDAADTSGWSNQHTVKATGSMDLGELVDGLSLNLAYLHYWFDEKPVPDAKDDIGDELNVKLTYDYTEDVQFALDSAYFVPGDYYDELHDGQISQTGAQTTSTTSKDPALSIVGSCKVSF